MSELEEKLSVIIESYGDHPCQTNLNCAVAEILALVEREIDKFREAYSRLIELGETLKAKEFLKLKENK